MRRQARASPGARQHRPAVEVQPSGLSNRPAPGHRRHPAPAVDRPAAGADPQPGATHGSVDADPTDVSHGSCGRCRVAGAAGGHAIVVPRGATPPRGTPGPAPRLDRRRVRRDDDAQDAVVALARGRRFCGPDRGGRRHRRTIPCGCGGQPDASGGRGDLLPRPDRAPVRATSAVPQAAQLGSAGHRAGPDRSNACVRRELGRARGRRCGRAGGPWPMLRRSSGLPSLSRSVPPDTSS